MVGVQWDSTSAFMYFKNPVIKERSVIEHFHCVWRVYGTSYSLVMTYLKETCIKGHIDDIRALPFLF